MFRGTTAQRGLLRKTGKKVNGLRTTARNGCRPSVVVRHVVVAQLKGKGKGKERKTRKPTFGVDFTSFFRKHCRSICGFHLITPSIAVIFSFVALIFTRYNINLPVTLSYYATP